MLIPVMGGGVLTRSRVRTIANLSLRYGDLKSLQPTIERLRRPRALCYAEVPARDSAKDD